MSRFVAAGGLQDVCLRFRTRLLVASRPQPPNTACRILAQRFLLAEHGFLLARRSIAAPQPRFLSTGRSKPPILPEDESTERLNSLTTSDAANYSEIERAVHEARQRFRDTLPAGYLTEEEYELYVRLYGPPLRETMPEDVGIPFAEVGSQAVWPSRQDPHDPVLLKGTPEGGYEEVPYTRNEYFDEEPSLAPTSATDVEGISPEPLPSLTDDQKLYINAVARNQREYDALVKLQQDFEAASLKSMEEAEELETEDNVGEPVAEDPEDEILRREMEQETLHEERALSSAAALRQLQAAARGVEEDTSVGEANSISTAERTHPYSQMGRFSTNPKTLLLPQSTFNEPIAQLLDRTSIKHVREAAEAALGGGGLPDSPSTPASRRSAPQKAVGLEAAQHRMSPIEADAYIATVMPPAYAATMSALVEIRKRLGTEWIQNLIQRGNGEGPRVLDVGAGGAGLAAWQDIVQAEWDTMRDSGKGRGALPKGKKTVVVGSDNLRHRISRFLHNTTFLPRLPDYVHSTDIVHRNLDAPQIPLPKKTYDVIIASYVLLPIQEGHRRKAMLNKLWSLLSPEGGVLVFIEKGHPRGFEAIADVRQKLIQEYLKTPADPDFEPTVTDEFDPAYQRPKEPGMIIAPCTTHRTCPMYTVPGKSKGRKDFCSFQQRFYRPRFLQQILGARDRNHDDVQFSYVAIQRGNKIDDLLVGDEATERAFAGYEHASEAPNMFTLPRQVLSPLKRKGHIQLEVCTPSGRIERWTVPKSRGKQSYHDARKAVWGDLWALGAKVRTPRSIRLGRPEEDVGDGMRAKASRKTRTIRVETDKNGIKHASETQPEQERRTKGGRLSARKSLRDELMEGDN